MRSISIAVIIALSAVFASMTACVPAILGENKFLLDFVNHEFLNVLIVIVTVSFVSVTQIHLEYSRVERTFGLRVFGEARREVNLGAKILVALLLASIVLVITKASFSYSIPAQSGFHGLALVILVAAIFIMYDFVRTVYVLASGEPIEEGDDDTQKGP